MPVRLPAPARPLASRSVPAVAAAGLAIALLLSGCTNPAPLQPSTPDPTASAGGGGGAPAGGSGGGTAASPTPAPPKGTPVSTTCEKLLPDLASFGTGFAVAALPADTSTDGLRADVLAMQGLACAFHATDGTDVEIDVAQPVATEPQVPQGRRHPPQRPHRGLPLGRRGVLRAGGRDRRLHHLLVEAHDRHALGVVLRAGRPRRPRQRRAEVRRRLIRRTGSAAVRLRFRLRLRPRCRLSPGGPARTRRRPAARPRWPAPPSGRW
ncbi:hypothetical protein [Clavibacter tessellarius]|uniref:hypothetical protein n=1 Tax=Clavibacter tessellarius TaxID=31965 RepID=UPI00324EF38E